MRFAGWYGVLVGTLMLVQWAVFLATGSVPEVRSEPVRLAFHLAAELFTAAGLVVSGSLLLSPRAQPDVRRRARSLYMVAVGMVIYSEIVSPGYFAQQGQWAMVGMFAVVVTLAAVSAWKFFSDA